MKGWNLPCPFYLSGGEIAAVAEQIWFLMIQIFNAGRGFRDH
jgi:hypothetical protein